MFLFLSEKLKQSWQELSDDKRFVVVMMTLLFALMFCIDIQHTGGFLHTVIFPVFYATFLIIGEFLGCIFYFLFRPLYCSLLCLMEVAATLADIIVETMLSIVTILTILFLLPLTVSVGLFQFLALTISVIMKTLVPLFLLAYYLSPGLKEYCRNILTKLQHSDQVTNQAPPTNEAPPTMDTPTDAQPVHDLSGVDTPLLVAARMIVAEDNNNA